MGEGKMKLKRVVEMYLLWLREQQYSAAHLTTVEIRLGRFLEPHQQKQLAAVTREDVTAFFVDLKAAGLASATLAGYKSTLRAFWRWCRHRTRKYTDDDPTDILLARENRGRHSYSYEPQSRTAVNDDHFQAVMASLESFAAHRGYSPRDVRDALIISLTADSAGRRGEIWNVTKKQLELSLERGKVLKNGRTVYRVHSEGKTGPVKLRFFDETAALARRWLNLLPETAVWAFVNLRTGQRLRRDAMVLAFNRACKFAGVPTFRFHSVRKRQVTDVIEDTGDPKVGQKYANHRSPRTTQIYYNDLADNRVDEAAAALSERRRQTPLASEFFKRVDR